LAIGGVKFDQTKLIEACAKEVREHLIVGKTKVRITKVELDIDKGGVELVT